MNTLTDSTARLQFYLGVVESETRHLAVTDSRLFSSTMTTERVLTLESDVQLAEQVDAFVARFGRLQDTLTDKLLPVLLAQSAERIGTVIDNLNRAEKLGWLECVEDWMAIRKLRKQMIHDYVLDPSELAAALSSAHEAVDTLLSTAEAFCREAKRRIESVAAS